MREIVHVLNSRDQGVGAGVCIDSITKYVDECYCVRVWR